MSIKIITDSASDILPEQYSDVIVLPMSISFDETLYLDGVTLTRDQFFEKLVESDTLPKTSQINPATFESAFSKIKSDGDEAIVITMSSDLSGTYQSACIAAEDYSDCISVIDSKTVCIGEHILIKEAIACLSSNSYTDREQLASYLESVKSKVQVIALLNTLEFLRRGGRISNTVGAIGEALSIKPVIAISEGVVKILGKARGSKNANNLLNNKINAHNGINYDKTFAVAYSGLSDAMLSKYLSDNTDLWEAHAGNLIRSQIGGTIGTHAGPDAIALAFFENLKIK